MKNSHKQRFVFNSDAEEWCIWLLADMHIRGVRRFMIHALMLLASLHACCEHIRMVLAGCHPHMALLQLPAAGVLSGRRFWR